MSEDHQGEKGQKEDMGIIIFKGALKRSLVHSVEAIPAPTNQAKVFRSPVLIKVNSFY